MTNSEIGAYVKGTLDAIASVDLFTRGAQQNLINMLVFMYNESYGGTPQFKVAPSAEQLANTPQSQVQATAQELFAAQSSKAEQTLQEATELAKQKN